jgi:uncharacterized OsmC-like protein
LPTEREENFKREIEREKMEKEKCQREIEEMQKELCQLSPTLSTSSSTLQVNFKKDHHIISFGCVTNGNKLLLLSSINN